MRLLLLVEDIDRGVLVALPQTRSCGAKGRSTRRDE